MTDELKSYRTPRHYATAIVSLDEFSDTDIANYLRHRGYYVSDTSKAPHDQDADPENVLNPDDLDHVSHLALCGQLHAAREEALVLVGNAIGWRLQ